MLFLWLFLVYVDAKPLVAAFLSEKDKTACILEYRPWANGNLSCENHPIVFDPPSLEPYETHYGQRQELTVLAWAGDDKMMAATLFVISKGFKSKNLYPHITVSNSVDLSYGPEYSNALWERVVAASSLIIDRDQTSKTQK